MCETIVEAQYEPYVVVTVQKNAFYALKPEKVQIAFYWSISEACLSCH